LQVNLAWSDPHKIISSHNLGNALQFVINDHSKVVGGNAVSAPKHHVVDFCSTVSEEKIGEANDFA